MLFDFLIEVLEEEIGGKSCFIMVAAKHSPHDINMKANNRMVGLNSDDPTSPLKAVVEQIKSDLKTKNTDVALYSNKIDILFFDESNKEQVFYSALAKGVYWLMQLGVNRGRYSAYAKIKTAIELGADRTYEGFSSFAKTATNKKSHSVIAKNISDAVSSVEMRNETVKRILNEEGLTSTLVECKTATIEESKQTIKDFLCMGLYIIPIKTQDVSRSIEWFNENYANSLREKELDFESEYSNLIQSLKKSIVELAVEFDVIEDIEDLNKVVDYEGFSAVREQLGKVVYVCSAAEAIWAEIVLKEAIDSAA